MATFKCNDPIYTVLRNGKVISNNRTPGDAIEGIAEDAARNVCAPECCITAADIALDTFDLTVTTETFTGLSIRITITSGGNTYSTAWEAAGASNTFDLTGLIVEVGGWFNGDTVCVEYSYNQDAVIEACCATVITEEYVEDDTYDLTELVRDCPFTQTSGFDLLYQNPDGGVTVSADGEMVVPDIDDDETVFVARNCNGCLTELLVLSVTDVPLELGLRLTYTPGNLPANNLAAWNAFFDLPANGTAFTSMSVTGDEVTLIGGGGITLKPSLFRTSDKILKIEDDVDCVVAIAGGEDLGALSLCDNLATVTLNGVIAVGEQGLSLNAALTTINLSACTSAGIAAFAACTAATTFALPELLTAGSECFAACTAATTFTLPLCTTIGDSCFDSCTAATTFDLSDCTALGSTTGDNGVFAAISGNTITITVPTALSTCNGGNPDGDLVWLDAQNPLTINFI